MKRRVICFIISLALCLNLCPVWAADEGEGEKGLFLNDNMVRTTTYAVDRVWTIDTREYTLSGNCSPLVRIDADGDVELSGTVLGKGDVAVQVMPGASLTVTGTGTSLTGTVVGLDIAEGASVTLSGGSFSGKEAAIKAPAGFDFASILDEGCAFFDQTGKVLTTAEAAGAKKLSVGACEEHDGHGWTPVSGAPRHGWECRYCDKTESEECTFEFDENGSGACETCGGTISIEVDEDDLAGLVYDGTVKPQDVSITVTLGDGTELAKDADYSVDHDPKKDAGEDTITVTGITFNGTFTKTYHVEQAEPGISWADTTCAVNYDSSGLPVAVSSLPAVVFTKTLPDDLRPYLQYSYRKSGDTEFTPGLPTNAGEYEVKAFIPESQNYKAVETDPCLTLTIRKIAAVVTAPSAKTLSYNREAQELVTAGVLKPGAAAEGAVIEYKLEGVYSTEIPTGVGVSSYSVYYRVAETENYTGVTETLVLNPDPNHQSARINHREIKPTIELEYNKTMYTGEIKEPKFTVKDGDYVIPGSEYTFAYTNNRNVGTATLTITNASNGNYKLTTATATFQITNKPQDSLTITQKPNSVTYGDTFTLGTQGGSGSGDVTWEIIDVNGIKVAEVGAKSGQVTIVGDGEFTVKATKSGKDPADASITNYDDATASWTVTAAKKPVTATVTAEDKTYGETYGSGDLKAAKVHAAVEQGVLPGDEITITGLTGTFSDENAGVNKTVTVDTTGAIIEGDNSGHYAVTYSGFPVKATIHKAVVHITTPPDAANLTYNGGAQALLDDSVLDIDTQGVSVEYALSESGPYSPEIPEGTNAGDYTVWYRVKETDNYTGQAPESVDVTIKKKPVEPEITLGTESYIYDGNEKKPLVTLHEADGITLIPAGEYTVEYSDNVNVGTAAVTVTAKADGNYEFDPVSKTFEIKEEQARVLTAPDAAGEPLYFNERAQKLVTAGAAYGGTMVYRVGETGDFSETIPTGTNAGDYTVYYKVAGDGNHSDSDEGSLKVTIAPKTVKDPTIELLDGDGNALVSYTYDGSEKKPTVVVKDGSTVIDADEYNVVYGSNRDAGNGLVSITDKPGGNYTVTGSATFVIQKADIEFDPAPAAAALTYDGKAHELLVPGTTSGGEVLYALNSATSTYTAAIPTGTEAGDYTVFYKVIGDKNHNDFAVQSVPVTIQRKPLTAITIELSPEGFDYDGTVKLPRVTVKDGNTVLPEEEYSWTCDVESPTNVGTYTITVRDEADGNYDLSGVAANTKTFSIGKVAQKELVIEDKPASIVYGDKFTLTTSGGSGSGDVTWSVTGTAADVNATTGAVEITGVGEVTITVKKAASTNYLAAEAQWTFTAAPRPVTAVVTVSDKPYDGNTNATVASATITAETGDTVTIDPATIIAAFDTPSAGAGKTVTLDTSKVKVDGADAGKYAISYPATVTADITQANTNITKDPEGVSPLTYNGTAQALVTAGTTNVGFIEYSLDGASFSPEIPTGTNAGDYRVYYKVDGTADYTGVAVNATPITVTIDSKTITPVIEVSEDSYLYDGTKKNPAVTVKDGRTVIDAEQYTVSWDDPGLTDAKTYTATIENVSGGNYTFSETVKVEIVAASQAALNITGQPEHVYYGDTVTTLKTSGGSGNGTVTWSITDGGANSEIDPGSGKLTVKDTGSITVKAERTVPNYAAVSDTWTFTVEPKPVIADVTVADKVYDGNTSAVVTSVGVNNLVDSADSITINGLTGTFADANVGDGKTVNLARNGFTIDCDTNKYTVSIPATAHADITPRQVTVTVTLSDHDLDTDAGGDFYIYDGSEKRPAVTVTGADGDYRATLEAGDYSVDYAKNKNFGTADVTVTASEGGNYTFDPKTVHFEIRKGAAVLTETPRAKDLTYDGKAQDLVTVGSAAGGTVVYSSTGAAGSYSETIPQETNAGTYTVYYMVKGDGNHDDTAPGQVSVTIKPREITPKITLSPTSYMYDGNECKPAVTVEDGNDTIGTSEYSVSYLDNTNAGTAKVIVSDANGGNYIVNGTASFEITKAASTFTAAPAKKDGLQYNGTAQVLVTAGASNDGTVMYSLNGGNYSAVIPTAAAVGTYTVSYKIQGDANHEDTTPVELTVKIDKNTVNSPAISLSSEQFTFNGSQQKPTVTAVYDDSGLLIPEREYSVTFTGGNMVDVGTYTVTVTTPENSSYDITGSNTRTFEIVPANQETISISGTRAQVRYGDTIQLGITGGTGSGTVNWTVTDKDGNAVSSEISATGLLSVKDVGGPLTVTATRSAGGNYSDVSASWEFSAAKKPVTAVVTVADKPYDGNDTATIKSAGVNDSDLLTGDTVAIIGLSATFDNPNVGQNKTVNITITGGPITDARYDITIPATTTASITAVDATVDTDPTANSLTYDASQAQELVTAGTVTGGILVYSLDRTNFTPSIPKGKDAGTYTVYFKAQGDGNHTDSAVGTVPVTIGKQSVTPQIKLSPSSVQYDGKEHTTTVTLWDGDNNVIPESEYKVTYVTDGGADWTKTGTYTVKIENIDRGNYKIVAAEGQTDITATFTISATAQNPLEITNKPGLVYYGDTFTLSAVGGSGDAAVTWSVDPATGIVEIDNNGFVKIVGTGSATITATKPGGANYDTVTATYPLNALAKPITAIVTAEDKVYDGNDSATFHVTWNGLVGNDTINTSNLVGTFEDKNAGTNKKVIITGSYVNDATAQKYVITIPGSTTASILKADAVVPSVEANDRVYDGTVQPLVTGGNANTTLYSDSRDGVYSASVPTGTNAGSYTVWYKEPGDANHNDSAPRAVTVTISRKELTAPVNITLSGNDLKTDSSTTPPTYSYVYDGTDKKPTVTIKDGSAVLPAGEYTLSYTDNKNVGTATVTITSNEGGNYTFDEQKVTFAIISASAQLTKSPEAKNLTYTGQPQELVTTGTADGGHIEYLQKDGTYKRDIPEETDAGTYTVTYKVVGDGNYTSGGETWTVSVTIKQKEIVSPKVTVSGGPYTYSGSTLEPAAADIKVEDGTTLIPDTEYTVSFRSNIDAGTATVIITNANGGNYIVNGTGSFVIEKADAAVGTAPGGKTGLKYNGAAQELVTAGTASGGTMVYSLEQTGGYSPVIPTGTAVDSYTVYYKVQGDGNHNDTVPASVAASIIKNTVTNPTVQISPGSVTYNGKKQEPAVTVKDDSGLTIDGSEYTVTYADGEGNAVADPTNVGTYNVTITGKAGGNYSFSAAAAFEILPADQTPLTITGQRERVCYGDKFQLGTTGGSGAVTWAVDDGSPAAITNGLLTITGVGSVTVTATSSAPGYADQTATWSFYAEKKPVTAVVTAESKTYDGVTPAAATVTATLQSSDLVGDDVITIKLSGSFDDPNAGTGKTVRVDSSNPDFTECTGNYENYNITYPATATASIFKADIKAGDVTAPTAAENLEYTGIAQALVKAGSATGGTMEYSADGIVYSASLPTGTDADSYEVWYRVKGDSNHNDTAGTKLGSVTIAPQDVENPIIEFEPNGASYDGAVHKPKVTVKDKNGREIPDSEYTVDYGDGDWKTVGTYTVTVTDAKENGGNYVITKTEAPFEILMMGQNPLTITNQPSHAIYYGDAFTLSTTGGSGTGTIKWEISGPAGIDQNGNVKVTGSGPVTITATKQADANYGSTTASWTFSAGKKPVKAVVTAKNKVFDTNDRAELVITWKDGDLVGDDEITLHLTGTFDTADVGTNKTVTISGAVPDSDKYDISYNTTTTASITQAAATVTAPTLVDNLTYTGQPQPLVNAGSATNGTIMYSLDGIVYGPNVPKGTNAGEYTVWYKVTGSENYKDVAPAVLPVTIAPKTVSSPAIELSPESFDYDGSEKKPSVVVKDGSIVIPAGEYTVSYSNNVLAGTTAKVTISDVDGGNYIVSGEKTFTIKSGAAVLTSAPEEKDLTYTGSAQALVTKGTAVNGKVMYSLDDEEYSTTIPKGTNAGTYEVYYMVKGNEGFGDTEPESVTVTIKPKQVTPIVLVNGGYNYTTQYTGSAVTPPLTVIAEGKTLTSGVDYYPIYSNNDKPGTATVIVQNLSGNYQFTAIATFEITKAKAEFLLPPRAENDLVYTGEAQKLVKAGMIKTGGTVVYSLDGVTYSPSIPKGTEVDDYVVFAKILGNDTYSESDVVYVDVSIGKNKIDAGDLTVELTQTSFKYTGSAHTPGVTVTDDNRGNVISASEYSVSYSNNIEVGTASVTVKSKGSNYSFSKTVDFQITDADAPALTITGKPDSVCYGDTVRLGTTGGSGTVTWLVEDGSATSQGGGQFKITGSGSITIKAATSDSSDTWTFFAVPKPVKAIVTAADKEYDSNTNAALTVTVSGLVSGDSIGSGSVAATGSFADANVGTNKTVTITGTTVSDAISEKYNISFPETTTASITPAPLSVTEEGKPKAKAGLTYTGQPQALVSEGTAADGNMAYSLDGTNYVFTVPTGTDAGTYTVWYKAVATDENHKDSAPGKVTDAAIAVNTGKPTVTCSPSELPFDGSVKTPSITVLDSAGREIPSSEYTVTGNTSATAVGEYTVTVRDKSGSGNYEFSDAVTGTYKIVSADQNPLSIVTDIPTNIHYGDTFKLSAIGGSGSGAIKWKSTNESVAAVSENGVVTVRGTGEFTIEAYRAASGGYSQSNTDTLPFHADPKPVTPTVTAYDKQYDGKTDATLTAAWKTGDLVNGDTITINNDVTGAFATADVGTNKRVSVVPGTLSGDTSKYVITWPDSATASIYKVNAEIETAPQPADLTYNKTAQALLTGGSTKGNIGTIVYSTSEKGVYSTDIPTGTNAGTYSVWYKVADSVNYTGIPAAEVKVEIAKADPTITSNPTAKGNPGQNLSDIRLEGGSTDTSGGTFAWVNGSTPAVDGAEYDVIFTPTDTVNYNTHTFKVKVTVTAQSTESNEETQTKTTIRNGTASTVLSASDGSALVRQAVANQSQNVVIKPNITADVSKSEVSIPASTVSRLSSATDADLTVSSPVADVTIPNKALDTLGQAGGSVSVVTEQTQQGVTLEVSAGGETVKDVPGGVTLTVPVEDPAPGTVAVLVHEDGTRETVRNSVVTDGVMSVPLSGSATVEIVDNSKSFDDVPAGSWEADAVDFASSHELFGGTGETTFSPDMAMSRGMLATVLYRLEGNPELELTDAFSDVSDGAWYADGVAWAAENGIVGGYGDGQFGPNDDVTREQFVVMLWRYAGCPEAGSSTLDFADADSASGYAMQALCWAVENGIINGVGGGKLDPGGTATRAQAAQLLKNFMEKTR